MFGQRTRVLVTLLCIIILFTSVQAAVLQISVRDDSDNSTIPNATIFLNGVRYARTDSNGQVFLNHTGLVDQLIRATKAGYDDGEYLVAKNVTSVVINLTRKNLILKITLYDSDSLGFVTDAWVNISAKNLTQTKLSDAAGSAVFEVYPTTPYSVHITATGYLPREGVVDSGTETINVQYWLLPLNRFSFVILDQDTMRAIPDAEVHIDSVLAGKTDARGVLTIPVVRGIVHTVRISKTGYHTYTESRVFNETEALDSIVLSKALLGAVISTFDESNNPINGTDIFINGTLQGTTNQFGRSTFPSLVAGSYLVEARKTGYISQNRTILLDNYGQEFTFKMPFETADLTIFVEEKDQKILPGVTIFIDGKASGYTDEHGQYSTVVRFNTLYNITAAKNAYRPISVQREFVRGNATASLTLVMEKNPDWGLITLIVTGIIGILILWIILRMYGGRKKRGQVKRKDEL